MNKNAKYAEKGIKNLLTKKGIDSNKVETLIRKYGEERVNFSKKYPYTKEFTVGCIQENFSDFLNIVTRETNVQFRKNYNKKSQDNFDDGSYDGTIESVYPDWKD